MYPQGFYNYIRYPYLLFPSLFSFFLHCCFSVLPLPLFSVFFFFYHRHCCCFPSFCSLSFPVFFFLFLSLHLLLCISLSCFSVSVPVHHRLPLCTRRQCLCLCVSVSIHLCFSGARVQRLCLCLCVSFCCLSIDVQSLSWPSLTMQTPPSTTFSLRRDVISLRLNAAGCGRW